MSELEFEEEEEDEDDEDNSKDIELIIDSTSHFKKEIIIKDNTVVFDYQDLKSRTVELPLNKLFSVGSEGNVSRLSNEMLCPDFKGACKKTRCICWQGYCSKYQKLPTHQSPQRTNLVEHLEEEELQSASHTLKPLPSTIPGGE